MLLCLALLFGAGTPAVAQFDFDDADETPIEINADTIRYERARDLYVGEGNVRITQGDRRIDADWVVFSRSSEIGIANGNVVYRDGGEILEAAFLEFDLETLQALVYQASLDAGEGEFIVEADRIVRTGDDTYTVQAGVFTTCRCPKGERDPWRMRAQNARVRVGGYAFAENATLDVLGVPVVWLPWMVFPIKTERESGLLFPEFSYTSRAGFEVGLPIFWAALPEVNLTLTPSYLSKRGWKPKARLEYVHGERSKGKIFVTGLNDQKRRDEKPPGSAGGGDENKTQRWAAIARQDEYLPGKWRAKSDLRLISDNQYLRDFDDLDDHRYDRYLESNVFGFRQFGKDGRVGVVGSVSYADDLQEVDSEDRDDVLLQRLPRIESSLLSSPTPMLPDLITQFGFEYTHYYNWDQPQDKYKAAPEGDDLYLDVGVDGIPGSSGPYAGENNHQFDEGEPLADRGSRFVLHPRVAHPFRLFDRLEVYPELGYRQLLYATSAQSFAQQGHVTARIDLSSRLVRDYPSERKRRQPLVHVVEPSLGWTLVSNASDSGDPLFVPATAVPQHRLRQLQRENLILDPSDRVDSRNAFSLGVSNRWYRGARIQHRFDIGMDYNVMGNESNFSRLVVDGFTAPIFGVRTRFNLSWDPKKRDLEEGLVATETRPFKFLMIGLAYRYRNEIPRFADVLHTDQDWFDNKKLRQVQARGRLNIGKHWSLQYFTLYDLENKDQLQNAGGVEYRSRCKCWAIGVTIEDDQRGDIRYQFRYSILGIGDDSLKSNPLAGSRAGEEL